MKKQKCPSPLVNEDAYLNHNQDVYHTCTPLQKILCQQALRQQYVMEYKIGNSREK
jgi:hypothetical protein